ncbi:uncharacterized protein LOC143914662 [Arctopsyche grandis]|uniref:uncharacterized protein LOC143914662 n=1 Tax=Arctopsyche grandis TaxID=121162 RepID=UPI00406D943F
MAARRIRKKSKTRIYEQERRNRICKEFTALVKILPSTSPSSSRILILQQSAKYIKELQLKNEELLENDKKSKEQCMQLMQLLKDADITIPSSILQPLKIEVDHASLSPSSIVHDITNKIHQDEGVQSKNNHDDHDNDMVCENDSSLKILPLANSDSNTDSIESKEKVNLKKIPKKRIRKPHTIKKKNAKKKLSNSKVNNTSVSSAPCPANVLQKNSTINNVWLTNSSLNSSMMIGNTLLPIMPMASPIVMPAVPQPQTIFLVQRPAHTMVKEPNFPFIKQVIPIPGQDRTFYKTYSNIYGMDVTQTTMVNKVPISAFTSSSALLKSKTPKKKPRTKRVTQRSHRRLTKSLKSIETVKPPSPPSETNKENIAKPDNTLKVPVIEPLNKKSCEENVKSTESSDNKDKNIENKKNNKIESYLQGKSIEIKDQSISTFSNDVSGDHNQTVGTVMNSMKDSKIDKEKNKLEISIPMNDTSVSENRILDTETAATNSNLEELNITPKKSKTDNVENLNITNDTFVKTCNTNIPIEKNGTTIKEESCKDVKKLDPSKEKYDGIIESGSNLSRHTCESLNSENIHRLQKNKISTGSSNAIGASEIAEDILASFGGPSEQTLPSSPLASSPLAASPTAAFLLAFPLVCSGPRPDTPLNDNLQTPNICSLDNFSSFFSSKEPTANHIPSNLFPDCHSKPTSQFPSGKYRQNWLSNSGNSQNFVKNLFTDVGNTSKYTKSTECLKSSEKPQEKLSVSSSACVFSDTQSIYQNTKPINSNGQYSIPETMYNYDHAILNNSKEHVKNIDFMNQKANFNFVTNAAQSVPKSKNSNVNNTCTSVASGYIENIPSTVLCNNSKTYNYNVMSAASAGDVSNCKRSQTNDNCMKLVLPGVIPEYSTSTKSIDIPFSFPTQSKPVFPNSSNIYTSCNTYNPFSSDYSSNSMNLGIHCGNSTIRTKPSTTYIPDFNSSNIYPQNCNVWSDDQMEIDATKIDYNRRLNLPMPINQSQSHNSDFSTEIRFPPPVITKSFSIKQNNISDVAKAVKTNNNKCPAKDMKYSTDNKTKSEFINQKGPVNWMTSDVGQNSDVFYPNYKEIKHEQNSLLPGSSQACIESGVKKVDVFDQPYFPLPPSGYVSQVASEDNQFTWSPSKLTTFGDSSSLAPCNLPTLVGDLALSIGTENKMPYQSLSSDQDSSTKDRKCATQKSKDMFANKTNCSQNVEMNSSNGNGNFLSVSQLMERGKMETNLMESGSKPCMQDNHKRIIPDNQDRQFNAQLSTGNKPYELISHSVPTSIFSSDNYSVTQHIDNSLNTSKDSHFNVKLDSNTKNINKNNYSTESLLQNNSTNYQHMRNKQKSTNYTQKSYGDNTNFPIPSNQYIPSNHPLQFDNFPQNQQYVSNTFPYSSSAVTMNSTFYSSANFMSSNTTSAPNYINSGFSVEFGEFSNNLTDNIFYPTKVETCKPKLDVDNQDPSKYMYNSKAIPPSKDLNSKAKIEVCNKKDSTSQNKRQKKHKNTYSNNFGLPDRCFGSIANQVNSPIGFDDSFFGYVSSSQMHPYPSQPPLLSSMQPTPQQSQKINFPIKPGSNVNMSSSPNPVGTSLTNFNLSTIFPEINKRPSATGFNETQHPPSHLAKTLPSGLYH